MGFRGSRVQIPPSRFCPRTCGGKSFRRSFANAARFTRAFWSNPLAQFPPDSALALRGQIVSLVFRQRRSFHSRLLVKSFAFFEGFDLPELLRATAWRTSALKADSSTSSPSWMSIARRVFPSRLELKRRAGSFRDAPLRKVSFTTFL